MPLTLWLAWAGCTVDLDAGQPCEPVVISEIMPGVQEYEVDEAVGSADWFELENTAEATTADLSGYLLVANSVDYAWCEIPPGTRLAPGERMVVVASTYTYGKMPFLLCNLDFNNDSDRLQLLSPRATGHQVCDLVYTPDMHDDFTWQRDRDDPATWCDAAEPTPGRVNAPCLCEGTDDC